MFVTLSLPVLFGLMGLAVEVGWANWRKEAAQTAAQAAATAIVNAAGSNNLQTMAETHCPASPSVNSPWQVGCLFASQNGFTDGANNQTVTVQIGSGPAGVPVSGVQPTRFWVAVTAAETERPLFSALVGSKGLTVKWQAVAGVYSPSGGGCIYVLNPNAVGALSMSGTSSITSGCGVYVHSNAAGAISMNGSGGITTTGGSTTNVVGTVTMTNNYISPAANQNVTPHVPADPFAATLPAAPATGACQPTAQFSGSTDHTIPPGTYCDLVKQVGSATLTLSTGSYVLEAGIQVGGSANLITSGPVTLYVSGGSVDLEGSGVVTLSAPTSGSYQGIAIWQPASNKGAAKITGSSSQTINGLIYMPSASLQYSGTSGTVSNMSMVSDTLTLVGTSSINDVASTPWATLPGTLNGGYLIQ